MDLYEITCSSALHELKRKIPYGWDCNLYQGCAHGCRYCYACGSRGYEEPQDFSRKIYVKTNIAEHLERELSSPGWKREVVNLGGVTDSYQPAEARYQLMPEVLKLLIQYKTPAIISTKSDLVLRDFDLIDELSRVTYVNIAATVTTMDEAVREKMEPGAVPSARRFRMLKEFRKTNASTGLHLMPIVPYLTDSRENLEALMANAKDSGVGYVLPGTLYLRGAARGVFFQWIEDAYPELLGRLKALYQKGGAGKEYKDGLYRVVNSLRSGYGLSSSYMKPMREKLPKEEDAQLSFFTEQKPAP